MTLDDLTHHHDAILLTGAGALLHNLGKVSHTFVEKQLESGSPHYLYQHVLGLIASHCSFLTKHDLWGDKCSNLSASKILQSTTEVALTQNTFSLPPPLDDRTYCPGDMIEYLGESEPWYKEKHNGKYIIEHLFPNGSHLTHLMNRAHHGASGGEKQDIYAQQQTDPDHLWLSTPFGYEVPASSVPKIDDLRQEIEQVIQQHLSTPAAPLSLDRFTEALRPLLERAIADTRRPYNDVTVWDIGHSGMAFLVTQAVGLLLAERAIEHEELAQTGDRNTLFWRVLTVRTDGLGYLEEAASMADLRVRRDRLQQASERVREFLEEWPLAVEIYRDENGSFYAFPDVSRDDATYHRLREQLEPNLEIDGLTFDVSLSQRLTNHPNDGNGTYIGAHLLDEMREQPARRYAVDAVAAAWSGDSAREICLACGIRPQGHGADQVPAYRDRAGYYRRKAASRNVCCFCLDRRSGVAKGWATQQLASTTIWIDEVADTNGRLALLVGRWKPEDFAQGLVYPHKEHTAENSDWVIEVSFLDPHRIPPDGHTFYIHQGTFVWDAQRSALIGDRKVDRAFKAQELNIHEPEKLAITLQDVFEGEKGEFVLLVHQSLTDHFALNDTVKCWGQKFIVQDEHALVTADRSARDKVKEDILWDGTYPFKVEGVTRIEYIEITDASEGAHSQSFARIRRVWETTRNFWEELRDGYTYATNNGGRSDGFPRRVGTAGPRLTITGDLTPAAENDMPGDYHVYELLLDRGVKLSVVWDTENGRFITADNLAYTATLLDERPPDDLDTEDTQQLHRWGAEQVQSALAGGTFTLEDPAGYGAANKEWGTITVQSVEPLDGSTYTPAIPILAEPRTFMALVPADRALNVVQAAKQKYEREMGKVRNRLPLHLGVVYAHRRTPLRAVLDAGRRMLDRTDLPQRWEVVPKSENKALPEHLQDDSHFSRTVTLRLTQDDREATWYVPLNMGDGTTPDHWYPYVFVETTDGTEPGDRRRYFKPFSPSRVGEGPGEGSTWLVHASDLKAGDVVYFTPATVDFEWLDVTARRFEIAYDGQGRRRSADKRHRRPYLLDDLKRLESIWETLDSHLTVNQIHALRDLVESKREQWRADPGDTTFRRLCRDALANAGWQHPPWRNERADWLDEWTAYAARGWLADAVELHLQVMKQDRGGQ